MNLQPPTAYEALRKKKSSVAEINFGYTGISLVELDKIPEAQLGYSSIPKGDTTDWQDSWLVIGHETSLGDPIFIDLANEELPVLTAPHAKAHGPLQSSPRTSLRFSRF